MTLTQIGDTLIDETSSPQQLRQALDAFALLCAGVGGIAPDRSFDAWAGDTFLDNGVAINPQAAAHCVKDYQRSVVFIRGIYAAIKTSRERFPDTPLEILYAGCGPFATLLLPLLERFKAVDLAIDLLDIHQRSLDSVARLLEHFGLLAHRIKLVQGDACSYQHPGRPHLIIAETMQKSLEQEPQFAITANLAPQLCSGGIFVPQKIEVEMCLAHLDSEISAFKHGNTIDCDALVKIGQRHPLATVLSLRPQQAAALLRQAGHDEHTGALEVNPTTVVIPPVSQLSSFDAVLFTRIQVFDQHQLQDYESEITLPLHCSELSQLRAGDAYRVSLQLGSYPKFCLTKIKDA